jgi:hypothetical protein
MVYYGHIKNDIKVMTNIKLKLLNKTITADDVISLSENFLTNAPEKQSSITNDILNMFFLIFGILFIIYAFFKR